MRPGQVQVETGATWTRVDGDTDSINGPQPLVRIGLLKAIELRVVAPDWFRVVSDGELTTGWANMAVGVKGHLGIGSNDFALRGTLYVPTGSSGFSSQRVDPELALSWSRALSERWSLGATVDERWLRQLHQGVTSPSLSIGLSLSPHVSTFVEYGADLGRGFHPLNKLDHGYTWALGLRTQLDASLGILLSSSAPAFFVGAGFCHRF